MVAVNVEDITPDIVVSYAQACADLNERIHTLQKEGYDLLVIPSRGASPFVDGAYSYAHALRNEKYEDFDPAAPRIRYPEELYLPFTADIGEDFPISSQMIRQFWARVLAAQIRRDDSDLALSLYRSIKASAGDLATGPSLYRGGMDGRFIFVDTVVSGRAICEIFDGFARYGLSDCHYILLVDHAGAKLNPAYRSRIDMMVAADRATVLCVDRIFTEDEGPAMSGIWSVTMPELMTRAAAMVPGFDECVGAGLYYHEVAQRKDGSNQAVTVSNAILGVMLYTAVRGADASTRRFLDDFKKHVRGRRLQDQAVTKQIADPLIMTNLPAIISTDVSGSHVLRARMSEHDAENFIRNFLQDHQSRNRRVPTTA
jgi:hypothetical protein